MREALVFGGTGQIGRPLIDRLRARGWRITAVSRGDQVDQPGLCWLRGCLEDMAPLPSRVDVVVSCGPLDRFAHWYSTAAIECPRVVAFGSTSLETKRASMDAHERELATRLRDAESRLFDAAATHACAATVLRPTLVYGAGRDATLTRIAALARRFRIFPLPSGATGLRQPVHVDDLADAAWQALDAPASHGSAYALPGGETLPYRDMVARVLATLDPPARLLELPPPLFDLAAAAARVAGRGSAATAAVVERMRSDLVFDVAPAVRDLGYAPRAFDVDASMFSPRGRG